MGKDWKNYEEHYVTINSIKMFSLNYTSIIATLYFLINFFIVCSSKCKAISLREKFLSLLIFIVSPGPWTVFWNYCFLINMCSRINKYNFKIFPNEKKFNVNCLENTIWSNMDVNDYSSWEFRRKSVIS